MPANLENSAVATGLKKVHFHSNPKERQSQRMFKLLHNCTHLTRQQSNAQNSPNQASAVHEPRISRCSSWIQESQRNQRSNCQHPLGHRKNKRSRKTSTSALLITPKPLTEQITTNCGKFFKSWEYQTTLLPPEKSLGRSRSNSQNQTWNNRLVPDQERVTSRLHIVTLLIKHIYRVHHVKCQAG